MVFMILLGFFAGFGALSLILVILGWILPKVPLALIFRCPQGQHPDSAIARHLWLRSLGMVNGNLIVVGDIPEKEQEIWKRKHPCIEFITPEVVASVPELERTI